MFVPLLIPTDTSPGANSCIIDLESSFEQDDKIPMNDIRRIIFFIITVF
jgi:hypothetical protein